MIALALLILAVTTICAMVTTEKPRAAEKLQSEPPSASPRVFRPGCGCVALVLFGLIFFFGICLGPIGPSIRMARQSAAMQTTRTLALAMFQYANDNDGRYPDGKSSTEVFQKLMDGNYITDPAVFFVPLPGKVEGKTGAPLRPENIAYDATSGVDANSPEDVPVVFLTGFRMKYAPGAPVVSLVRPYPSTAYDWTYLFSSRGECSTTFDGLPVAYKSNNAFFRSSYVGGHPAQYTSDGFGIVPNVIAPDFDAHGQIYVQLTPDDVLK